MYKSRVTVIGAHVPALVENFCERGQNQTEQDKVFVNLLTVMATRISVYC